MPLPNAKIKVNKNGVRFESNVEAVEYSLSQLIKAALRDTAKFLIKKMMERFKESKSLSSVLKKNGGKRSRLFNSTQYWVRKKEGDLQIGMKHDTWYGVLAELGDKGQPKRGILRDTTFENIDEIQRIQAQYLSALNEERPNIPEAEEYKSEDDDQ